MSEIPQINPEQDSLIEEARQFRQDYPDKTLRQAIDDGDITEYQAIRIVTGYGFLRQMGELEP